MSSHRLSGFLTPIAVSLWGLSALVGPNAAGIL